MSKPPAKVLKLSLADRGLRALKAAVQKVIEEHARKGIPLYIWRDGEVVAVPAKDLAKSRNGKRKRDTVPAR